jgi:general secretion pathway protein D
VLIKSGFTLAMGGLMREDTAETYTKVPIMGDLPGLGALFRSKTLEKQKRNLLVFLTPTVVQPDDQNPTGLEKFSGGIPAEETYTNDKWMPKDNAKPRDLLKMKTPPPSSDKATGKPTQNFGPKQ